MTQKEKKYVLTKMFESAIDGQSSNTYDIIISIIEHLPVEARRIEITLNDLYLSLIPLRRKWEKEIDKVIG